MYLVKHILIILPAKKDDLIRIRYALIVLDIPWLNANIAPKCMELTFEIILPVDLQEAREDVSHHNHVRLLIKIKRYMTVNS